MSSTKAEMLNRINKLEEEIKNLKRGIELSVGVEDDNIFLLSVEEYEKFKDKIPKCKIWWWLRSAGSYPNCPCAAYVNNGGTVNQAGSVISNIDFGIRPAIRIEQIENSDCYFRICGGTPKNCYSIDWGVGTEFIYHNRPFTIIDENLAIASIPIDFDCFDTKSNDYKNSYIRELLLNWFNSEV